MVAGDGGAVPTEASSRDGRPLTGRLPSEAWVAIVGVVALVAACYLFPRAYPGPVALKGALLGTATGLLAVGLVLTYRATRVINFAYGGMGTLAATLAIAPRLATTDRGYGIFGAVAWIAVVAIAVAIGVVIGAVLERVIIRRFENAPRLTVTVATIAIAQIPAGLAPFIPGWFDLPPIQIASFKTELTEEPGVSRWYTFNTKQVLFDGNDMVLVAVVPIVLIGLTWFLMRTRYGIAVRGMADNMSRARLLGIPVHRLSLLLWAIAGGLAALTAVLGAPNSGVPIDAAAGPALMLAPLAAAVIGRMQSITVAFAAGVALGVTDQLVQWNFSDQRELRYIAYFVIIVVALLLQRRPSSRAETASDSSWTIGGSRPLPAHLARLPELKVLAGLGVAAVLAVLIVIPVVGKSAQVNYATITLIFVLCALSLVVLTGWGGVVSLGQVALMGVGGITAANLIADRNADFFVIVGASALAGGVVALLIGIPGLRVVGQYLAVTTLGFAVVTEQFIVKPALHPSLFPDQFERPELWGIVDLDSEKTYYVVVAVAVVVVTVLIANLRRGRPGRSIIAVRDNERRAAAAGVSGIEHRLAAFVFAGAIAGAAGALHAVSMRSVGDGSYPSEMSLVLFSMAVIGGVGSIGGVIAGVVLMRWLGYLFPRYATLLTGGGVLVVLMAMPGGLAEGYERLRDVVAKAFGSWRPDPFTAPVHAEASTNGHPTAATARRAPRDARRGPARRGASAVVNDARALAGAAVEGVGIGIGRVAAATRRIGAKVAPAPGRAPMRHPAASGSPPPGEPDAGAMLLRADGIDAAYGSFQVLFGIDAGVQHGEMLALLGTNGAGKSSLLSVVSGLLPATSGQVTFDGADITGLPAERIARHGLSLMPGGRGVFPTLTVAENLRLASWMDGCRGSTAARSRRDALALFPILQQRTQQKAGDLSGGEQQQLSLAMAFVTRPKLLCIDELSLGLAPTVVSQLIDKVREIHRSGTTVVVVEQSVNVALQLCEQAVFLEQGKVRFRGPTAGLLERPDVLRAVFLGERPAAPSPQRMVERTTRGVTLECRGLVKRFGGLRALDDVDLTVGDASIVGVIGHNGAGKTTLFDLIGGFLAADGGRVTLGGTDITEWAPHERAVASLGRSFQDARLFSSLTVSETLAVSMETHLANRDPVAAALRLPPALVSEWAVQRRVDEVIELVGLGRYRHHRTGALSTGTRRIVELGCLIAQDPAIILLDEPLAGVAQRETEAFPALLRRLRDETGCSMVVIEHNMPVLSELSDRFVAFELGAVIATGTPDEVLGNDRVIASYLGTEDPVPVGV